MTDRVNRYYQLPASKEMIYHMRNEIGLVGKYLEIFDDLRGLSGDTQLHADNVGLSPKQYNQMACIVGQTCVWELLRLAELGLKAEQKTTE